MYDSNCILPTQFYNDKRKPIRCHVTERSRVQVLKTTSSVKNRERLCTAHQMVGPLPDPAYAGALCNGLPFLKESPLAHQFREYKKRFTTRRY